MSNFAHAAIGLAVVACLPSVGCHQSPSSTLPRGSMAEGAECEGNQVTATDVNEDGRVDIEHVSRNGRRYCTKADMNFDGKVDVERFYDGDGEQVAQERLYFLLDVRLVVI